MDKIYSRKRIRLPKLQVFFQKQEKDNRGNDKKRKIVKFSIILLIAFLTANYLISAIMPIFETQCEIEAKSLATIISNSKAAQVMKLYEYKDLVSVMKDNNGNITLIQANVIPINEMISKVAVDIQEDLNNSDNNMFYIPLGSFTGSKIFSGIGPKIKFKVASAGEVETNFRSEFKEAGINQTLHRLYLEVTCKVSILTPFNTIQREITNQVVVAENIIVGTIPNTYLNLDGTLKGGGISEIE